MENRPRRRYGRRQCRNASSHRRVYIVERSLYYRTRLQYIGGRAFRQWDDAEVFHGVEEIKVGIISANWSLKVHGAAWRLFPDVEVAAVCTAHRETAEVDARNFNVPKAY